MNRRNAIKSLMMASGGIIALPAWAHAWKPDEMAKFNTTFTDQEIDLISAIADTIIPSNGEIGALSVGIDKFLVGLISRCYEEKFRGEVRMNLHALNEQSITSYQKGFAEAGKMDRENLLLSLSSSADDNDVSFFEFMKQQTIRGFETSEEVLVHYHGYVMMPGFYNGNVDVEA